MNNETYIEIEGVEALVKYNDMYRHFMNVFNLIENRKKITQIEYGIIITIRTKEDGHNIPHIHAEYQGENISISLIDCSILAGNISKKQSIRAQQFVCENMLKLLNDWESIHGVIKFPNLNKKIDETR